MRTKFYIRKLKFEDLIQQQKYFEPQFTAKILM